MRPDTSRPAVRCYSGNRMSSGDPFDDFDEDDGQATTVNTLDPRLRAQLESGPGNTAVIVILGGSSIGRMYKVSGRMIVGRSESAEIQLDEDGVSRRHAEIVMLADGRVEIADLGSTNGTWVEGEKIIRTVLRDGDKVQVGTAAILKFSYQDALEEEMQRNLYEAATRDGLTRLYNKKFFSEAIEKEVAFARRHNVPLSLMIVDADHFKVINDTWGHPAGDFVLQKLAQLMLKQVRTEDVVCRYGGEEFVILLRETPEEKAVNCAERIRAAVERAEFIKDGAIMAVTVSVGVASLTEQMADAQKFFTVADERVYAAKAAGRNRVIPVPSPSKA